ncbi:hypothetical protein H1R20_g7958, partial [Candolleomyces eurysporus]
MVALIVEPFQQLRDLGVDLTNFPHAILIDGLDECDEEFQAELLVAVERCLLIEDLPFRVFIASRPELAIRTALEPGGHLHKAAYHLQLSDDYDASEDMRRYLLRRFQEIGLRIGDPCWFKAEDIDTLVQAGSGQFVYVAAAFKYISQPRGSPVDRLKIILTWAPNKKQVARPFEALDNLYTNILLTAKKAYEAVDTHSGRDFLLLFRIYHVNGSSGFCFPENGSFTMSNRSLTAQLNLESRSTEIIISDLHSLVKLESGSSNGDSTLRVYHKSLSDFLNEESRAKDLFVPVTRVYTHLAKCSLDYIIGYSSDSDLLSNVGETALNPMSARWQTRAIRDAVKYFPPIWIQAGAIDDEIADFSERGGWNKIGLLPLEWKVYYELLSHLVPLTDSFKDQKPEIVAIMKSFFFKWKCDIEEERERRRQLRGISHLDLDFGEADEL